MRTASVRGRRRAKRYQFNNLFAGASPRTPIRETLAGFPKTLPAEKAVPASMSNDHAHAMPRCFGHPQGMNHQAAT